MLHVFVGMKAKFYERMTTLLRLVYEKIVCRLEFYNVLAHQTGCAGWTISSMDRPAMPLLGDITGSFRLVVQ
jgi:hypothetical protein